MTKGRIDFIVKCIKKEKYAQSLSEKEIRDYALFLHKKHQAWMLHPDYPKAC